MRRAAIAIACVLAAAPGQVHADDALVRGQALAKAGDYRSAIDAFRESDRSDPQPLTACLLGLAYLRVQALGSAQVMFDVCTARARTARWKRPKWVAVEEAALRDAIAASPDLGEVQLRVDPRVTALVVPALLDGEPFPVQGALTLPAGAHRVVGRTPDGELAVEVTIRAKASVEAALVPAVAPTAPEAATVPPAAIAPPPRAASSHVARNAFLVGGGAVLVGGALVHLLAVRPAYDDLAEADAAHYDELHGPYATRRNVTVGLYAVGAAAVITGVVLGLTGRDDDDGPRLGTELSATGGVITLGWTR